MKIDPAFEELYRREFVTVFKAAYLACGDRAAAEDAAQDAFVRAYERWGRLHGNDWITGWLVTTAINLLRRRRDHHAQRGSSPPVRVDDAPSIDARLEARRALSSLPARQREAVVLYYLVDLPISDVAQLMGCADGTVKAHLAKAREAMARTVRGDVRGDGG